MNVNKMIPQQVINFFETYQKPISIVTILLLLFSFIFSIITYVASRATRKRYEHPTHGLLGATPPSDAQVQADAKAAQDRDTVNLVNSVGVLLLVVILLAFLTSRRRL